MAIFDGVHVGSLRASLDGSEWNNNGVFSHSEHQPHIDELIRPKGKIAIVEFALEAHGPGGGIDLIVNRQEFAGGKFSLIVTAVCFDPQLLVFKMLDYFRQAVFR